LLSQHNVSAQLLELVYDATIRAPICFNQEATRTVVPYYELRSKLEMEPSPRKLKEPALYSNNNLQASYDLNSPAVRGQALAGQAW